MLRLQAVIFPACPLHILEEMDASPGPHHNLPIRCSLFKPRSAWRTPGSSGNESSAELLEPRNGLKLRLERCDMFVGHFFDYLDEVFRDHLSDRQEATVSVGSEGAIED